MAILLLIWIWTLIGVNSCGVDSAAANYKSHCDVDHECPNGYYCFKAAPNFHTCVACLECGAYKRTSSWRHCAKEPVHCGQCLPGFEEEILAGGKTRDFCVPSAHAIGQSVQTTVSSHYFLLVGVLLFLVPTVFYAFYWRKRTQVCSGHLHHQHSVLTREEPPPYRSTEVSHASSVSDAEECTEESQTLVTNVAQTKERLTQATPFRRPNYGEEQENAYNTEEESEVEAEEDSDAHRIGTGNLEIEDENTMPSMWTPDRVFDSNQLDSVEQRTVVETEDENCCQPSNKRRREDPDSSDSNTPQQQQQQQQQQLFNVCVNNIIIVKKDD